MISLLLTLLAIGLLAYFALRGFGGHGAQGTAQGGGQAAAVNCERAATALILVIARRPRTD